MRGITGEQFYLKGHSLKHTYLTRLKDSDLTSEGMLEVVVNGVASVG